MKLSNYVKLTSVMLCLNASADLVPRQPNETVCSVENTVCSTNGYTIPAPRDMVRITDPGLFEKFSALETAPGQEILTAFALKGQFEKDDFFDGLTCYGVFSVFDSLKNVSLTDADFKGLRDGWDKEFSQYENGLDVTESFMTDEIRQAIKIGKIAKDDYKIFITIVKRNSNENEYVVILKRSETLKVKGQPDLKSDTLLSSVFMKVNTRCMITKLCQVIEGEKNLDEALRKMTDIHTDWASRIRESNKSVIAQNQYGKYVIYGIYALFALCVLLIGRNRRKKSESASVDRIVDTEVPKGPVGIWGWNTIPLLNLAGIAIMTVVQFIKLYLPLIENGAMQNIISGRGNGMLSQQEALFVFLESVGTILIAVFAVRVIGLAFARRRLYPKACTWLFAVNALLSIIGIVVTAHLGYSAEGGDVKTAVQGLVFSIIWGMYFSKSERIKNTFTR